MNTFSFGPLSFAVTDDGAVALTKSWFNDHTAQLPIYCMMPVCEFDTSGGRTTGSNYLRETDEAAALRYVRHTVEDNTLKQVIEDQGYPVTQIK